MSEGEAITGHIVVCGLDGLALRTIEELHRMDERVVVIKREPLARYREPAERLGARMIEGDPQDPALLGRAGIPGARAMILTDLDDVGNVHAALAAHALDPDIRLVVRVFDEEFGTRIEELVPGSVSLSASALAVAGFVAAVVDDDEAAEMDVLGHRLVARHAAAGDPGVLVQFGDDRPTPVVLFPPPGVGLLSLVDTGPTPAFEEPRRRRSNLRLRRPRLPAFDARVRWLAAALFAMVIVSTAVFQWAAGVNVVDGVYNTISAFFGGVDQSVTPTPALRIFAIVLILVGAAGLATLYALIADAILTSRLATILGTKMPDARGHVIIVGLGTIGFRIADELHRRGITVLAADPDADSRFAAAARKLGIAVLPRDGRDPAALEALHIGTAACLVAATDDDAANLATALHSRTLRPDLRIVVRLFDPELAEHLGRTLGDYRSRSVSALAAPAFAAAAIGREVIATVPVGLRRVVIVARLPVDAGSVADGSTVGAEQAQAALGELGGGRIVAIAAASGDQWTPADDVRISASQDLIVVATRRGLGTLVTRTGHRS